jgi:hypothetical protein
MANSFERSTERAVGTARTKIGSDVASNTVHIVFGVTLSNITANTVSIDMEHRDSSNNYTHILSSVPIPAGSTISFDGKINLLEGDSLNVTSTTATSVDVIVNYLEQTN